MARAKCFRRTRRPERACASAASSSRDPSSRAKGRTAFVITDNVHDVAVAYQGLLPDLFREGQGVVAEGVLEEPGRFRADSVLAKHDERYMPREVVDALKKQGRWQEGEAKP
jgi:cytochrome c-type biogenesis protein CcmE